MNTLEDAHTYLESKGFYVTVSIKGNFLGVVSSLTGPNELGLIPLGEKIGRSLRLQHIEIGWQVIQWIGVGPITNNFPDLGAAVAFVEAWLSEIFEQ